ncbi:DUF1707 domain-containing protein [Actinoplanes sp. NPDC051851]|uniref:DUF1707 SHOCT-like domain-containing protein n=1 Tax=Actinoplanes sp. NPDC051851 TaxID=3154753 RepID=UPI0034127BE0
MGREGMRAGDADRQRVADQLKTALDEGRLDLGEYDERLQRTYAAKTYGDLDGLLGDLPGPIPRQRSQVNPHPAAHLGHPPKGSAGQARVAPALGAFLICTLIWAISSATSGHLQYFWPAWVLIPVVLSVVAVLSGKGKRHR